MPGSIFIALAFGSPASKVQTIGTLVKVDDRATLLRDSIVKLCLQLLHAGVRARTPSRGCYACMARAYPQLDPFPVGLRVSDAAS
jgi:hypothetical protein